MSFINLKDLIAKATVDTHALVKRPVEWKRTDAEGKEVVDNFDIHIVKDISFAASDRIYLGDNKTPDSSKHARLISERVRLGENGEEQLTPEQAGNLEQNLGWALAMAVSNFDKENAPKVPEDVKESSQETSSGTN